MNAVYLEPLMKDAEEKAWKSFYKFQMFGYWAAIWVHMTSCRVCCGVPGGSGGPAWQLGNSEQVQGVALGKWRPLTVCSTKGAKGRVQAHQCRASGTGNAGHKEGRCPFRQGRLSAHLAIGSFAERCPSLPHSEREGR